MPTKRYSTEQIVSKLRQAEVDMVLVGTLVRAADQFLVRTQLLEVPSWTVVWSHNAKVAMQSLFQLEDDLTRRLVDSLSLPLTASEDQQLHRDTPQSASAYEFYLRANELGRRPAEWSVARDLYERSVEYDPAYAPAWARLGRLHRMLANVCTGMRIGRKATSGRRPRFSERWHSILTCLWRTTCTQIWSSNRGARPKRWCV